MRAHGGVLIRRRTAGKNWRLIKNGMIDDSDVFAIAVDPRNPDHIISSACSGIYESQNAGEKWSKIQGIPSQSRRTRDIMQHPTIAEHVLCGYDRRFLDERRTAANRGR